MLQASGRGYFGHTVILLIQFSKDVSNVKERNYPYYVDVAVKKKSMQFASVTSRTQ